MMIAINRNNQLEWAYLSLETLCENQDKIIFSEPNRQIAYMMIRPLLIL